MKFTKMHGIGNNYVYFDCFTEKITDDMMGDIAIHVADKNFGIGSDGAIFICPSDVADAEMKMYNADGSYGKMCGNGIRCVAKYMYDHGMVDSLEFKIASGGQVKVISIQVKEEIPDKVTGKCYSKRPDKMVCVSATVDMGEPVFDIDKIPVIAGTEALTDIVTPSGKAEKALVKYPICVDGKEYLTTCVSVGNPHSVIYMDEVKDLDLVTMGPGFENHPAFPERVNTEFVKVLDRNNLEMRVYERGSAETLACGTGATATVVSSVVNGYVDTEVTAHLLGGELAYKWDKNTNHIFMTGPAEYICEGDM